MAPGPTWAPPPQSPWVTLTLAEGLIPGPHLPVPVPLAPLTLAEDSRLPDPPALATWLWLPPPAAWPLGPSARPPTTPWCAHFEAGDSVRRKCQQQLPRAADKSRPPTPLVVSREPPGHGEERGDPVVPL